MPVQGAMFANQWRMSRMQLVNWGTFCGYHDLAFDTQGRDGASPVTMITGESGTGKSTLLDAKTAVLMPYNVRFNAASNRTTKGRARGEDERNVYSYLLGQRDNVTDARTGESRKDYLRDHARANWSAIVLTFVGTDGSVFCAAKFYSVPADSQRGEYKTVHVTAYHDLDPRVLEPLASEPFTPRVIRSAFDDITVHERVGDFLRAVYAHLEIGVEGDGRNAMRLHEQIQSGYSVEDVDGLFKALVIDEPSTYAHARAVVEEFDERESAWKRMELVHRKLEALAGIRETHESYLQFVDRVRLLESLGPGQAQGMLALWVAQREAMVCAWALDDDRSAYTQVERDAAAVQARLDERQEELERLEQALYDRGGGQIDRLRADVERTRQQLVACRQQSAKLDAHLQAIGHAQPAGTAEYEALREELAEFLADETRQRDELEKRKGDADYRVRQLTDGLAELQQQIDHYRAQRGLFPQHMTKERDRIARLLQVLPSELPFAGELMDLAPEHEDWRAAANVGYHGLARTLLVDKRKQQRMQDLIDGLSIGYRQHFEGVDLERDYPRVAADVDMLSAKLVFDQSSPYAGWLAQQVRERDWRCVDAPEQLDGSCAQITRSGQERKGSHGAHGYAQGSFVIGFENESLIAELQRQVSQVRAQRQAAEAFSREIQGELRLLSARHDAALWVADHEFGQVDVRGAQQRLAALQEQLEALVNDPALAELTAQRDAKRAECDELREERAAHVALAKQIQGSIAALERNVEDAQRRIGELGAAGVAIGADQERYLEELGGRCEANYMDAQHGAWELVARNYERVQIQMETAIRDELSTARRFRSQRENELTHVFAQFRREFLGEESDVGTGVESYPDYLEILEDLERNKLDEPLDVWLSDMVAKVASQLITLGSDYAEDLKTIRTRMGPINEIMGGFSFGPEGGHLEIHQRDERPADIDAFRTEMREWTRYATERRGEHIGQREHARLRAFVDKVRADLAGTVHPLLNTQRLVTMNVTVTWPAELHKEQTVFTSLSAKSGGENQELVAFILGAALLYCLGDGLSRPSFSPVFLDEAFIKADDRHTRRAIRALTGLGFQVIIAVPTSKVQEIEPVADQFVCVTKDRAREHSAVVPMRRGTVEPKAPR